MAFLSKKLMAKSEMASVEKTHPLLKGREVSQSVRLAYLQGCVLATLLDDAQVSADERRQIEDLGRSLGIDDVEIAKSLEVVQGLQSDEDQELFLKELKAALGEKDVIALFMADFERLMQKPKGMSAEAREGLDFIGGELVGSANWRGVLASCKGKQAKTTARAPVKTKPKGKDIRAKSIAFRKKALEFIETLKPDDFDIEGGRSSSRTSKKAPPRLAAPCRMGGRSYEWTGKNASQQLKAPCRMRGPNEWMGKDAVRKTRDKVRKHVAGLGKVDVDVKDVWKYHLSAIKRKYIEERPEDQGFIGCLTRSILGSADPQSFDNELFFETIWFLAYLSFVYNIGNDGFDSAIKLSDLEWLFEGVKVKVLPSGMLHGLDAKMKNESFIWRLLTVASKTIETDEPEDCEESAWLSDGVLFCKGWWDE